MIHSVIKLNDIATVSIEGRLIEFQKISYLLHPCNSNPGYQNI